jgi:hypothetical protein
LYQGKRVRVCFDPAADPCRAAVVLRENSPGTFEKAGAVITHTAELTSNVPLMLSDDQGLRLDWDCGAEERVRRMKAIHRSARQWIFRAFAPDGRTVHTAESETRGPGREIVAAIRAERADPSPAGRDTSTARVRTDAELEADLARTLELERRAQERGQMQAVPEYVT